MFDEDLFNVFNETSSSAEKSGGQSEARSSRDAGIKTKHREDKGNDEKVDNKRSSDVMKKLSELGQQQPADNAEQADSEDQASKRLKVTDELSLAEMMPRIQVHRLETIEACTHEVAIPPGMEYVPLIVTGAKPPKEYPFILDPFQKEALLCLENNQSVLVSAHTSAGKTVVAEYAVAMSLRDKQRVIYTTPIKALSNQKYRELFEEFQDVGLMTGDVTINPTASALVMTTEILRSMLYRGSEIMREVGWVIFDEIHYMRDKERGVVWEETIILLPDNVHFVFLSATIPNASQFAEWICYLHKQPCHVVYTEYRPTPLQHYIFPAGGDGIHLVVDENGDFREENFNTAMTILKDAGSSDGGKDQRGRRGGPVGESSCYKIVKMIMERNYAPVIVFSFSKKDCESYATQMSKLDFNTAEEKKMVDTVFNNAIDSLSDDDKKLPQVEHVLPFLRKGIGIHHSGLLPLLKETIEILFSEGLIKALFATETFAMGLNMPARTVLFTSTRKFDGRDFRWISSGEYIQMSGRAGRRGLDDKGIVILMVDEKMSPSVGKQIIKGNPDPLNSAFHLTYNMVLNLLRVEEINPEYMLERSFYQFQNYASIPALIDKLKNLEASHNAIEIANEDQITSYYKIRQQLDNLSKQLLSYIQKPQHLLAFLQPGRLIKVVNGEDDFGWGAVVNFQKKANQSKQQAAENPEPPTFVAEVLLHLTKDSARSGRIAAVKPSPPKERGEMQVVPVTLQLITAVSAVRLYIPSDLRPLDNRMSVLKAIQEVQNRFPEGLPPLDPVDDMGIKDHGLTECVRKTEAFERRLYSHPLHNSSLLEDTYSRYHAKLKVAGEIRQLKAELKQKRSLLQMDELKCRKRVLRRMGYATAADVIELKGRVACEVSSADELVVTELLFNGVFNDLTPEQCCALLCCFAFQEKSNHHPKLTEQLSGPLRLLQETARRIAKVSVEAKLQGFNEDEYVEKFRPNLMDVVHSWCKGSTFAHICQMTDVFEGSIIRCMRRLEETMREMCQAAKTIGNTQLENKFSEGIRLMKRDIVFAASLYL